MLVGIPKEIKIHEYRVGLTSAGARELCAHGHQVVVQTGAGLGVGLTDEAYIHAGAQIVETAEEVFSVCDLIIKVKEPLSQECQLLREHQILFTFLHLAPNPSLTKRLLNSGAACIAYETITDNHGGLPLLAPMSEVAGRMSIQKAAHCLEKSQGGAGVLMGGVPGVAPANVLIIGGGVVGLNAARMAMGLGANVTVLDNSLSRLKHIDQLYGERLNTLYSTKDMLEEQLKQADAVIGAVLIPGAAAPKLITQDMLSLMRPGSVLVDVAIDQGGCFATSKPTTHDNPTFEIDGIIHYCVANMPGGVARTSTFALTNATMPYTLALADKGLKALTENPNFLEGLNVHRDQVTHPAVAKALGHNYVPAAEVVGK